MVKRNIKQLILSILFQLGFVRLWCFFRRKKVTIITFHGVMDNSVQAEWEPLRPRISRKDFDSSLRLFKNYFNFITMSRAVDIMNGKTAPIDNSCVVTFDDGQLNNYTQAMPILRKYSIPAIFYPATKFIDQGVPYWFDRLDYAIQLKKNHGTAIKVAGQQVVIDQSSREANKESLNKIIKGLKELNMPDETFKETVDSIISRLELEGGKSIDTFASNDDWAGAMTWDQVIECANSSDIEIGSHTVNHVRLAHSKNDTISFELSESKRRIESKTGKLCPHFCFPNGAWNYDSVKLLRNHGYQSAVTSDSGSNKQGSNVYTLKRYSVPNKSTELDALFTITGIYDFKSKLSGFFKK